MHGRLLVNNGGLTSECTVHVLLMILVCTYKYCTDNYYNIF